MYLSLCTYQGQEQVFVSDSPSFATMRGLSPHHVLLYSQQRAIQQVMTRQAAIEAQLKEQR